MKKFKDSLKGLAPIYKSFRWRSLVSILTGFVSITASMLFVWLSKVLIDIVTGESERDIDTYVLFFIGVILVRIIANVFASLYQTRTVVRAQNKLRYETFAHVLGSRWNGKEEYHSADTINRIQEDIRVLIDLVCVRTPDALVTLCQLIAASVFLIAMAPKLLGLLIALMVFCLFGSVMFYRKQWQLTSEIRGFESDVQRHVQDNLQNRSLVLAQIGISRVLKNFEKIQDSLRRASFKRQDYSSFSFAFVSLGFMAGYAAAFLWGIFGIRDGSATYGMMVAFLQLVGQVQRPLVNLGRHVPAFIQALISEERLAELNKLPDADWMAGDFVEKAPAIVFDNVTFSYSNGGKPVLDGFNCEFPAGSITVITGQTGKGKSTLVHLAMGLLSPQSGNIYFNISDGKSRHLSLGNFMYVPQDNYLLSGTIRENLQLAAPDASEDMIKDALHTAAADFVFELPHGLDTLCGESGSGISRGQAQRIAIARALLHRGTVLILDEATSALDNETERIFLERLSAGYRGKKTILFVSHRGEIESYADRILNMD